MPFTGSHPAAVLPFLRAGAPDARSAAVAAAFAGGGAASTAAVLPALAWSLWARRG
ncbi:hypothetical protein ACWKWC_22550 [Geodermatophilus nigrescens]